MDERSNIIKRNILGSAVLKIIGILISFAVVPLTINYINTEEYGVWLTISSVFSWIAFFDIGLTNGLRNKLTETFAKDNFDKAQKLISTTLALLAIIITVIAVIFTLINNNLNWNSILNTDFTSAGNFSLHQLIYVAFVFFCLQFFFKTVGVIYVASQKPAINDLFITIGSLISLLGILYLTQFVKQDSLFYVSFVFSASPAIVYIAAFFYVFTFVYKNIKPRIKYIDWSLSNDLLKLGIIFFLLQISGVVLYLSSNLIITQLFSPHEVTVYNIAFKYCNIISIACLIVITPLWSSATDAYVAKDWKWFNNTRKKMKHFFVLILAGSIILTIISPFFYRLWVGDMVKVPITLTISVIFYNLTFAFSSIYIYMLNGIGKLRIQTWSAVVEIILFVPVCVLLGKVIGVEGVPLGMGLILIGRCIWAPIQLERITNLTTVGIWNK